MKHLLFVPAPEYRDPLLGEGVCGSVPPLATKWEGVYDAHAVDWRPLDETTALVLAWDGAAALEGIDRLVRVSKMRGFTEELPGVRALAARAEAAGLGTVVVVED